MVVVVAAGVVVVVVAAGVVVVVGEVVVGEVVVGTVVVDAGEASVVVVTAVVSAATVVDGAPLKQPVFVEVTLTMAMSAMGTMAITETRCIDERIQRVTKIPATRAKIANTATVVLFPVSGNTQSSAAFMNAPYVKFHMP